MNIDQDECDHSRQVAMTRINEAEVIDLTSDDEEDPRTVQHKPEGKVMHDPTPWAMDGILQPEQRQPAHAAMNGIVPREQHKPARAATNGVSPWTLQWHYIDPQGDTRGPFSLVHLLHWKRGGFFDEGFRVWRTGQTSEQAILLRDALLHLHL